MLLLPNTNESMIINVTSAPTAIPNFNVTLKTDLDRVSNECKKNFIDQLIDSINDGDFDDWNNGCIAEWRNVEEFRKFLEPLERKSLFAVHHKDIVDVFVELNSREPTYSEIMADMENYIYEFVDRYCSRFYDGIFNVFSDVAYNISTYSDDWESLSEVEDDLLDSLPNGLDDIERRRSYLAKLVEINSTDLYAFD